ncbi:MAG: hypothetical protein JSS39_16090 [Nitrospira sp.]|nr:hypothetical protein [Nitrospira sp.]
MKLYRGDSIPAGMISIAREDRGHTFANHFCGNGLMAKFADNGSSTLLRGKDLLDMVLSHVGYERGEPEQGFSYRSPFLSFSQYEAAAFSFAERTGRKALEPCPLEDASYFVWELDADLPSEAEVGRYELVYRASSINCRQLVADQIRRGLEREAATRDGHDLMMGLMNLAALSHADADPRDHRAELIDVVKYIQKYGATGHDQRLFRNSLERAGRSHEWLLYPTDPMEDGPGVSSRFAMNQHLRVHRCYRVR